MKPGKFLQQNPPRVSLERSGRAWMAFVFLYLLLFLVPIQLATLFSTSVATPSGAPGTILGTMTDNSGRYVSLPLLNFQFDTELRDPATIGFSLALLLFVMAMTLIYFYFKDFERREKKYSF